MMAKRWEAWEDELARECPRNCTAFRALACRLGRTENAVRIRVDRLTPLGVKHERWTPEQDAAIREWMAARDAIMAKVGRPLQQISRRAWELRERDRQREMRVAYER